MCSICSRIKDQKNFEGKKMVDELENLRKVYPKCGYINYAGVAATALMTTGIGGENVKAGAVYRILSFCRLGDWRTDNGQFRAELFSHHAFRSWTRLLHLRAASGAPDMDLVLTASADR